VIADELRRMIVEGRLHVGAPASTDVGEYYATYGESRVRRVETKSAAPWLGNRRRGFALESNAPPQLFTIPQGRWQQVRTMRGVYQVRALDDALALGAVPLELARPAVANALKELARADRYDAWLRGRERRLVDQAVCRKDAQPQLGLVPLTDYLPFLAAE